jgi:glutathione peroxidase
MAAKVEVNGRRAHPIWQELTRAPDSTGRVGEVLWNFEKFLIDRSGRVVARFGPRTDPATDEIRTAVEKVLQR